MLAQLKLSGEEREALESLIHSDGYKVLVKVLDTLAADQEKAVLAFNLETAPENLNKLAHTKSRAEGARKLVSNLLLFTEKARAKPNRVMT